MAGVCANRAARILYVTRVAPLGEKPMSVKSLVQRAGTACLLFAALSLASVYAQTKPNIVILGTGGTIAGAGVAATNTSAYKSAVVPVDAVIDNVPAIKNIANVRGEQVFQIGSESFNDERLITLAKRVSALLKQPDVDGIVITHGTDTIEETSYFLNLTVKSAKPVVVVGSMRPGTALSADGALNLYEAVIVASAKESAGKGTLVVMNDEIHSGRDVSKTNTFKIDTFKSPYGPLGYVVEGQAQYYRAPVRPHTIYSGFDIDTITTLPRVGIAYAYGNVDRAAVDALVASGVKGIIYAATGNGSVSEFMVQPLIEARSKGVQIIRASRTGSGVVVRNGEQPDDKYDFVVVGDQNPQKARILLALALANGPTNDTAGLQKIFWSY